MLRYFVLVLVTVSTFATAHCAENLECSRFMLCLREEDSPNAGLAFITQKDKSQGRCIVGRYKLDKSRSPASFEFTPTEAWQAKRDESHTWYHSLKVTGVVANKTLKFEWTRKSNKTVLTHIPSSKSISLEVDGWKKLGWGGGEILEFSITQNNPFPTDELPPYLAALGDFANRIKSKPQTIFGSGLLTDRELMFVNTADNGETSGFGALVLKPNSDKDSWKGQAWSFHYDLPSAQVFAGRGTFHLYGGKDDRHSQNLELQFPRVFARSNGDGVSSWKVLPDSESGLTLKFPLTDRGYGSTLRAYPREFFFLNEAGKRENRYYTHGFFNLSKSELNSYSCLKILQSSSLEFRSLDNLKKYEIAQTRPLFESLISSRPPEFSQSTFTRIPSDVKPAPDLLVTLKGKPATAYRKALASNPNHLGVLREYIKLLTSTDTENLRWAYQQLARLQPNSADANIQHAKYAQEVGNRQEAIAALRLAVKFATGEELAHCQRRIPDLLFDLSRYKEAYESLETYVKAKPKDLESYNLLVWWFAVHGETSWPSKTVQEFTPLALKVTDAKKHLQYHQSIAGMYAKLGRWDDAILIQSQVVEGGKMGHQAKLYLSLFRERMNLSQGAGFLYWEESDGYSVVGKLVESKGATLRVQKLDGRIVTLVVSGLSDSSLSQLSMDRTSAKPSIGR